MGTSVFQRQVLERLDASSSELAVAVDAGRTLDAEAMKVTVSGVNISAFGKGIGLAESAGESIGIERIQSRASGTLFDSMSAAIAQGETGLYYGGLLLAVDSATAH